MGSNRLGHATSAYLRSAAHQPVEWHPWGDEPFELARRAGRPVLLDIGAVWCHWCHVMDSESYEDPGLADFLNRHFICVKVDRDERPDVDARYQRGVQAITRQGGWPLTGFLTPDAELFFGGTYFPPVPAHGRASFRQILERVHQVWQTNRADVDRQAAALRAALTEYLDETSPGEATAPVIADAAHRILAAADRVHGGFGSQPKFPHPATLLFLLHHYCDAPEPTVRDVIQGTLDGMARGGFRDQLGGGFHRYSVDERWIVPHFEKMASDNAELLGVFSAAGGLFRREEWLRAARETVRWFRETLAQREGGYGASQDADLGQGDDGSYFTWSEAEVREAIPGEGDRALAVEYFGIGTHGRMPHDSARNVLFVAAAAAGLADRFDLSVEGLASRIEGIEAALRAARASRPAPFVDPTRYANWNAMVASAMIRSGPVLGDADAVQEGVRALERLRGEQTLPDRVAHSPGGPGGLLDDPVECAAAAIDACEASGDPAWLHWAGALMDRVWEDHWDPERGGFMDLARGQAGPGLLTAPAKPIQDSPNASPNGVAGITLARLFEHTRAPRWRERHQALVTAFAGIGSNLGLFASSYLLAADWLVHPATHLLVTGPADDPGAAALHRQALAAFVPRRVVVRLTADASSSALAPALGAFAGAGARVRAVACTGERCLAPVSDAAEWSTRLRSLVPAGGAGD